MRIFCDEITPSPRGVRATGGVASRERRSVSSPEFLARDGRPSGRTLGAVGGALPRRRDGGGFEPASSDAPPPPSLSRFRSLPPFPISSRRGSEGPTRTRRRRGVSRTRPANTDCPISARPPPRASARPAFRTSGRTRDADFRPARREYVGDAPGEPTGRGDHHGVRRPPRVPCAAPSPKSVSLGRRFVVVRPAAAAAAGGNRRRSIAARVSAIERRRAIVSSLFPLPPPPARPRVRRPRDVRRRLDGSSRRFVRRLVARVADEPRDAPRG